MDEDALDELIEFRKKRDHSAFVAASAALEYFNRLEFGMTIEDQKLRLKNLKEIFGRYREASLVYYDLLDSYK